MIEAALTVVMYHVQHPSNARQKLRHLVVADSAGHFGLAMVRLGLFCAQVCCLVASKVESKVEIESYENL